jgi:release factor glutamine methyltransferase
MDITAALNGAAEVLGDAGVADPRREAASLMAFVLGRDATFLFAHPEYQLTLEESSAFQSAITRRAGREPFQYIVAKQEFYGLDFEVTPDVLIPRPETEILVEAGIEIVSETAEARIFEIGVGSGCISISILHTVTNASGLGVDISDRAIAVARRNAIRHRVADRLTLRAGNIFDGVSGRFNLIASNPPYIPLEQLDQLQPEVRMFEPYTALSGGPGGLDIIEAIVKGAPEFLLPGGSLLLEIGFGQSDRAFRLFDDAWKSVDLLPDLQGIPRIVRARLT